MARPDGRHADRPAVPPPLGDSPVNETIEPKPKKKPVVPVSTTKKPRLAAAMWKANGLKKARMCRASTCCPVPALDATLTGNGKSRKKAAEATRKFRPRRYAYQARSRSTGPLSGVLSPGGEDIVSASP